VLRAARPDVATELHGLLTSAAIAAAVAAGFPATLDVPVVDGEVRLPGLGVLAMPGASVAQLSSSTRPGEVVVGRDGGGEPLVVTWSCATPNWRPVPTVEIDGLRRCFDDVDAERLSARDRDARAVAVGEAWSSVGAAAPQLAEAMDKMITTVPTAADPATNPLKASEPVGVSSLDPWGIAVVLVEHVARSIVAATHRACDLFDTHKAADRPSHPPESLLADAYALRCSLQLAEGIERCGEPVHDLWVAARQEQIHQLIDELARDDRLTDLGRLVLNGMDDRVADVALRHDSRRPSVR